MTDSYSGCSRAQHGTARVPLQSYSGTVQRDSTEAQYRGTGAWCILDMCLEISTIFHARNKIM